jgi:hypothetical protein
MVALAAPPLLAMLVAIALGGSMSNWSRQRSDWWPAAMAFLALQVVIFTPPLDEQPWLVVIGPWLYVASMLGVFAVLLRMGLSSLPTGGPLLVAALGVGLNIVVVSTNSGYMPRSATASAAVGRPISSTMSDDRLVNVREMNTDSRLPWLGDIIPQPAWLPFANVVSVGDLLLAGGLAAYAYLVTSGRGRFLNRPRSLTPALIHRADGHATERARNG